MTTSALISDLKRDEGLRLAAYPDPLSGGDPWTIGYGHTGNEVKKGLRWTPEKCEAVLVQDIEEHTEELDLRMPWWRNLDPVRQDVIANMAFNLGVKRLLGFKNTLALARAGDYHGAAKGMLASAWAGQVGARAQRLARMMRDGKRA